MKEDAEYRTSLVRGIISIVSFVIVCIVLLSGIALFLADDSSLRGSVQFL